MMTTHTRNAILVSMSPKSTSETSSTAWEILGYNIIIMNTLIRRFFSFLLLGALFIPSISFAQDIFPWTVLFHLKEANGVLSIDTENRFRYEPVPGRYGIDTKAIDPTTAPYYGEFQDQKGSNLLRFGVEIPSTVVAGKNYTAVEVWAPLRGDAVKAVFFTKEGKRLFEISTRDTLVCNNNTVCDAEYGENGYNCPLECPVPESNIETLIDRPSVPPIGTEVAPTPVTPGVSDPAPTVTSPQDQDNGSQAGLRMNPLIVYGGFSLLALLVIGFIVRAFLKYKKSDSSTSL